MFVNASVPEIYYLTKSIGGKNVLLENIDIIFFLKTVTDDLS